MHFTCVKSRDKVKTPAELLSEKFARELRDHCDAEFLDAAANHAIGAEGLPFNMPICLALVNCPEICDWLAGFGVNFEPHDLAASLAPILNMVITIPVNFIINKFWAYRQKKPKADSDDTEASGKK